ncbi:hypothetical protein GCM10020331_069110 [Ectobacillus funiculus]
MKKELYEMVDLGIGRCKFSVASIPSYNPDSYKKRKTIATKYPNVASAYFRRKGEDVEIIKIEGSVEIAPFLALQMRLLILSKQGQHYGKMV